MIFHSYLIKLLVTVPLVLGMVHWLGLIGGVVSWLIAEALGKVLLTWRVPRALRLRSFADLAELVPWPSLGRAAVAALGAAAGLLVWKRVVSMTWDQLPHSFFWRLLPIGAASALFGVLYLVGLHLMGVSMVRVLRSLRRPVTTAAELERPPLDVDPTVGSAVRVPSAADAS